MKHTVITYGSYGAITGFLIFILHLALGKGLDYGTLEVLGYLSIVVSLSFIYFGIKHYRDRINNGSVSLGKAILIGVLISVLVGVGIAIADFIYTAYINPDFFKEYSQMLINEGKGEDVIEMTSTMGALFMLALVIVIGFIITIISGVILQRK
jgi:predicted membrane protein